MSETLTKQEAEKLRKELREQINKINKETSSFISMKIEYNAFVADVFHTFKGFGGKDGYEEVNRFFDRNSHIYNKFK